MSKAPEAAMTNATEDGNDERLLPHQEAPEDHPSPVIRSVAQEPADSTFSLKGHPLHAMSVHFPIALVFATLGVDLFYWWSADPFWVRAGLWASGAAFLTGLAASIAGTFEILLSKGIRVRAASWNHAVAAMTLLAVAATNWGLRLDAADAAQVILPHGLLLSVLAAIGAGFAGWHGGKLVYDHGVGLVISSGR